MRASKEGTTAYRYCGRDFSEEEMDGIRRLIAAHPPLHRAALSRRLCEQLRRVCPDGALKQMSCSPRCPPCRRPVAAGRAVAAGRGTCYRAANWRHVGQTQGRGKLNKTQLRLQPIKDIFLYRLNPRFRHALRQTR
jgi:hypothetical protein